MYYKFTASIAGVVSGSISNTDGQTYTDADNSFIIPFTAATINEVDESQLSVVPNTCVLSNTFVFNVVAGETYFILVYRDQAQVASNINISIDYAQVPVNDLIENAIEITTTDFVDNDIRLDFATASTTEPSSCGVGVFNRVYYKFTASITGTLIASITNTDGSSVPASSSFIIPFTATNINEVDESQLTVVPDYCFLSSTNTLAVVGGQTYFIMVYRDPADHVASNINISIPLETTLQADRDALIALFNATGGSNWAFPINWNTNTPVNTWFGVGVANNRVVSLSLGGQNLTGTDISSVLALDALESLDLSRSQLSGAIPDFTVLPNINSVNLRENNYSFQDFETNFSQNTTVNTFFYAPQNRTDTVLNIELIIGDDYTFSMTPVNGTNVTYQWFKNAGLNEPILLSGETSNTLSINNAQDADIDSYFCKAYSPVITDLVIDRNQINFSGDVLQSERDTLMAIYNALDGPNWGDQYSNWATSEPVGNWNGVTVNGNKVGKLNMFFFPMTGMIPNEIGDFQAIEHINISGSLNLTGPIPDGIGNLTTLKSLFLQALSLSGQLPSTIGDLTALRNLRILDSNLSGDLPVSLGNLVNLESLIISSASVLSLDGVVNTGSFTGTVPQELLNLVNLELLRIRTNSFSGVLPDFSVLPNLTNLNVSENNFSFSDLAPNQAGNLNIQDYFFSPQNNNSVAEDLEIASGQNITLDVNAITSSTSSKVFQSLVANQYQWFKDDVLITGAINATYVITNSQVSDSGIYRCEITNTDVANLTLIRADIDLNITETLSVNDQTLASDFTLYPNPVTAFLNIKYSKSITGLQLTTINGQVVFKTKTAINQIDLSNFNSGLYFLKIETEKGVVTKKVVKE